MLLSSDELIESIELPSDDVQKLVDDFQLWTQKIRPPKAFVKRVYRLIDKYIALAGIPERSPCKAKCNACCKHAVITTPIEAHMIAKQYNISMPKFKFDSSKDGVSSYVRDDGIEKYEGLLCPFNKDGQCQVYEWRPIVCRSFFSVEPTSDMCQDPKDKPAQFNHRSSPLLTKLFDSLSTGSSFTGRADIRDYFGSEAITI